MRTKADRCGDWWGRSIVVIAIVVVAPLAFLRSSAAQITLGTIEGTIAYESKAVLPGVAVTLTSPALQVPQRTTVSDGEGKYRFPDLRVGIYRVQAELAGFQDVIREGV